MEETITIELPISIARTFAQGPVDDIRTFKDPEFNNAYRRVMTEAQDALDRHTTPPADPINDQVEGIVATVLDDEADGVCEEHGECGMKTINPSGPTNADSVCVWCLREALHSWLATL